MNELPPLPDEHYPYWFGHGWRLIDTRWSRSGWTYTQAQQPWPVGFDVSQLPLPKYAIGQRVEVKAPTSNYRRDGEVQEIRLSYSHNKKQFGVITYVVKLSNGHVVPYCEEWLTP